MCIFEFILTNRNALAKSSSQLQIETKQTKTIYFDEIAIFPACRLYMLFLTNELAKEAEKTILSARNTTRPGFQAVGSWVMT